MERITVSTILRHKSAKIPLVALTCYDAASARLVDQVGVDIALVGDSLGNTRLGYSNTLPVTLDEMLHHTRAASRGIERALLVADMPFQTYESAPWQAAIAAGRFIKEAGAGAVKVEGGARIARSITAMLDANIPVMGHLGLTPQSVRKEGGYRVHGRRPAEAKMILNDSKLLERLGVFALVLEGIPASLAARITRGVRIPTIGIGAGPSCDGQVLVLDDVLGWTEGKLPSFVRPYARLRSLAVKALGRYANDVRDRRFPDDDTSYR